MLESLHIKNYRNLKDLKIDSLGQVNLITGRNNTGKSSLLEAISLYMSRCDLSLIYLLLEERGEDYRLSANSTRSHEADIKSLSSLFSKRNVEYSTSDSIWIGTVEDKSFDDQILERKFVSIRFVKYLDEIVNLSEGTGHTINGRKRTIIGNEDLSNVVNFHVGLEITGNSPSKDNTYSYILPLGNEGASITTIYSLSPPDNFQFIRSSNIDREINAKLWDSITLTEKEKYVIEALKVIEPIIDRLNFIGDNERQRKAMIKLKGDNEIVPLKSMGDGINRILTIILAVVNCDNGYLLIDEFENGLHYSVQEKLWEIMFKLSENLNVQVFATTHSEDCIRGFERVLNADEIKNTGKLIRLDNVKGTIKQTEFSAEELKIATESDIEIR